MKRRLIIYAIALIVVFFGAMVLYILDAELREDVRHLRTYRQISVTMSKSDVEAVFGRPADQVNELHNAHTFECWRANEAEALFIFDNGGRIKHMTWNGTERKRGHGLQPVFEWMGIP